ncbi:MAG TPA: clan AA aspartic protease [Chloroflexota bacterium]|nr:clan AA aspartic protease [Chloroflexota bacterium]
MGEVRASVRLVNAVDLDLVRGGLMTAEQVRSYDASALVDTGAISLVIPSFVAERLGLNRTGNWVAEFADGRLAEIDVVLELMDLMVDCYGRQLVPNPAHPDQPVIKIK